MVDQPSEVQRIDQHTALIDVGMRGLAGAATVYLKQGAERFSSDLLPAVNFDDLAMDVAGLG